MAKTFLNADETFIVANNGSEIVGGNGNETIQINSGITGLELDGNIEKVELNNLAAADVELRVNNSNQLEFVNDGNVVATATAGLNSAVDVAFSDGNATLTQTGGASYTLADPDDDTDSVTVDANNSQDGNAVGLGDETSSDDDGGGDTGQTFTLTTGIDALEGTEDDDTFIGTADGNDDTYQSGDTIDGGAGTDKLNLTMTSDTAALVDMDNVEQAYVRTTANTTDVEASGWVGVEQLWYDRGTEDLEIDNVGALATVGIKGGAGQTDSDYTVTYDASVVEGSADTQNVVLEDADAAILTVNGVETFAITSTAEANTLDDLVGDAFTSVTASGSADLTIGDALRAAAADIDVSDVTGATDLTFGNVDTDAEAGLSYVGGSGNDTIDATGGGATTLNNADASVSIETGAGDDTVTLGTLLAAVNADASITLDGGDGTDTLAVSGDEALGNDDTQRQQVADTLAGFEVLGLTTAADGDNLTLRRFDFEEVSLTAGTADDDVDLIDLTTTSLTIASAADVGVIDVTTPNVDDISELSIAAGGEAAQVIGNLTVTDGTDATLSTLNLDSSDQQLTIGTLTTAAVAADATEAEKTFTLNVTGSEDVATGVVTLGTNQDKFVANASADTTIGGVTANDDSNVVRLELNGAGDVTVTDADIDNITDGILRITATGEGEHSVADISGSVDADIIRFLGDGTLTVGGGTDVVTDDGMTLDASEQTGDLTLTAARSGGNTADSGSVNVGTGNVDATISGDADTEGTFSFSFAEAGIGTVDITGFAAGDTADDFDVLDFSNLIDITGNDALNGMTGTAVGDSGTVQDDDDDSDILTVTIVDTDGDGNADGSAVTAADGAFDGTITLAGITDLGDFAVENFDFA